MRRPVAIFKISLLLSYLISQTLAKLENKTYLIGKVSFCYNF